MKKQMSWVAALLLVVGMILTPTASFAQRHDRRPPPPRYVRHKNWRRGYRLPPADWRRGRVVDYRTYRLSPPPRGYEWRSIDGNYVLAAVATGVIASVIAASAAR